MRKFIFFILILLILNCKNKTQDKNIDNINDEQIEKEINDLESREISYSQNSLLDTLYEMALKDNKTLKELNDEIKKAKKENIEINKKYNSYDEKNKKYYDEINTENNNINNEVLKKKIKELIKTSETNYNNNSSIIKNDINDLLSLDTNLNDYISALKIIFTIPYIEAYQKKEALQKENINKIKEEYKNIIKKAKDQIGEK